MTGLNPQKDVIIELAAEITNSQLETIASYEARIAHPKEKLARLMQENTFWKEFPDNRDDFLKHADEGKPLAVVERELIDIVQHYFKDELAVLAGNSVHSDKKFIEAWMPQLDLLLHYRILDVSSWKLVMQSCYGVQFEKPEVHRAYEDIQASIAELQFYLEWLGNPHDA
jgi:oligoribonuclease